MKVILLKDVPKVGNRYDVKDLKDGFAQNVLIGRGLAEVATPQALARLDTKKKEMSQRKEIEVKVFNDLISQVNNKTVTLKETANEKGHLFSAVPKKDIVKAIQEETGLIIEDENIIIPKPIKEIGSHQIKIKRGDREGVCTVIVK